MSGEEDTKALQQVKPEAKHGLPKYVKLNVGGHLFQTTISTLTRVCTFSRVF